MSKNLCPDAMQFAKELQEEVPEAVGWLNSLENRKMSIRNSRSTHFTAVVNAIIR